MSIEMSGENFQRLTSGEIVTLPSKIESSSNQPVSLDCYILPSLNPDRKWVLITAVSGKEEIGFIDARYFTESKIGVVEAPHLSRTQAFTAPHTDIRTKSGNDGFFVIPAERGRKIGQTLFEILQAILTGLGATTMTVEHPKPASKSFYERNGGKTFISGYYFEL